MLAYPLPPPGMMTRDQVMLSEPAKFCCWSAWPRRTASAWQAMTGVWSVGFSRTLRQSPVPVTCRNGELVTAR